MRCAAPLLLFLAFVVGCEAPKPTTKAISSLDEIQGKWTVVEATDPQGNGFEADNMEMNIEGNKAVSDGQELRLELAADASHLKLYAKVNGIDELVGEVVAEITTEANPVQMVWMDRKNTRQVTLFQRK